MISESVVRVGVAMERAARGGAVATACSALTSHRNVARMSGGGTSVSISDSESVPQPGGATRSSRSRRRRSGLEEAFTLMLEKRSHSCWKYELLLLIATISLLGRVLSQIRR